MKTAMIFAAGLGTRLRPLTDTMPKALVEVAGKPLLEHILDKLTASAYGRIVVNVHHFPDQIIDFLRSRDWGAEIMVSDEREQLMETGGGILKAEPLLEGCGNFLVHNVDIISNLSLFALEAAVREDAVATLVVSERETARYLLFDDEFRLRGWCNTSTGELRGVTSEKGYRKLAFSGIHLLSGGIFDIMRKENFSGCFSIIDFYLEICGRYPVYGFVPSALELVDVGKFGILENTRMTAARITAEAAK